MTEPSARSRAAFRPELQHTAPTEPDPVLEDEAPEPRPAVVAHARLNDRPGVDGGRIDFYDYRESLRRD